MVDEVCLVAILFDLQRLRTKQKDERGGRGKRREREGGGRAGQQVWAFGFGSGKISVGALSHARQDKELPLEKVVNETNWVRLLLNSEQFQWIKKGLLDYSVPL